MDKRLPDDNGQLLEMYDEVSFRGARQGSQRRGGIGDRARQSCTPWTNISA